MTTPTIESAPPIAEGFPVNGYPATAKCGHPPHGYCRSITCHHCGVFKLEGRYIPTEGEAGERALAKIEALIASKKSG